MPEKSPGFWGSMPGILTGIAAVITATTGLYLAMKSENATAPVVQKPKEHIEVAVLPPTPVGESTAKPGKVQVPQPHSTGTAASVSEVEPQIRVLPPFPERGPLVDCIYFPTVNTVASLMGWSNYYHKQIIAAEGKKQRAKDPCNQAIDQRGMAHCKAPEDLEIRRALLETLTLCRAVGIEWQNIKRSTIILEKSVKP
ncbi:MAG: hypothetical protein L3J26_01870 [Candidatus Polarisedimenticolaceae bacterium]|nr:hypothetical protein [Candidatus Polarisedimenticolaceae bacterium]